jgi:SAM-dependent methyltransferase
VTDWFESFFDEHYLETYGPRFSDETSRAEAIAAVTRAGCAEGARVLDAPCGYGRHSIPLAEAGYDVTGLDLSPQLLEVARARAGERRNLRLVEGDLRQLPFEAGSFDCALNLFTSIGFLGDDGDREILRELRRVLVPGGPLVVETIHRDRLVSILRERDWERLEDGAVFLEERRWDPVAGTLEGEHRVLREGGQPSSRTFWQRVYTATELVGLLEGAGFGEIRCFGSLEGGVLSRETRLVVVATK